uniref:Uncharacterized protein n=1 Tax=Nelumbo nucifera TaxID=4432 RepID=A0A822YE99_NELNU|nr:TPA_asm: hypothetical protein HUJ06_009668 [Nelumbo nucifera]
MLEGVRNHLIKPLRTTFTSTALEQVRQWSLSDKLYYIHVRLRTREWNLIYGDINGMFREMKSVIAREHLSEKIKSFALQSLYIPKRVLASSTTVLAGGANLLFTVAVSIVSGAAGLLNFISQLMVFFWLLYYLITSESGGVMDHVLGMLPVSKSTRVPCAQVLDRAVSSVRTIGHC